MNFYDKNGVLLQIGDHIVPDEGRELLIVSILYVEEYGEECMLGQQVENPLLFSILTKDNLSTQWSKNTKELSGE